MYKQNWSLDISKCSGKLRTFASFKQRLCKEDYLSHIKDIKLRTFFTKFRISCHRLSIETGRYKNVPIDQRICKCCDSNNIEDEIHFAMQCNYFIHSRTSMLNTIYAKYKNIVNLDDKDKFIWLMSNENAFVLNVFVKFLYDSYEKRSVFLSGNTS